MAEASEQAVRADAARWPNLDVVRLYPSLGSRYARILEPMIDRLGGLVLAVATLPLLVLVVPFIWVNMGFPAIFVQERVGLGGRTFKVYKLRTMRPDRRGLAATFSGDERRVTHKSRRDPRVTRLGSFLRKWSVDELPQFWNVALGRMSLVGPRPEILDVVDQYEPWQHERHLVKPGITGIWQISARGDRPMHERTDLDLACVDRMSFATDLRILLRTIPAALGRRTGF